NLARGSAASEECMRSKTSTVRLSAMTLVLVSAASGRAQSQSEPTEILVPLAFCAISDPGMGTSVVFSKEHRDLIVPAEGGTALGRAPGGLPVEVTRVDGSPETYRVSVFADAERKKIIGEAHVLHAGEHVDAEVPREAGAVSRPCRYRIEYDRFK